ncbi:MAG: hypothetical protein GPJ14_13290 [Microcystis aeruginosa G11-01]|nr:hypothetical protein [Microcystis aeruginosa G11-01]
MWAASQHLQEHRQSAIISFSRQESLMQEAKERIWQFSHLKRRLETKHIKAFSLTN